MEKVPGAERANAEAGGRNKRLRVLRDDVRGPGRDREAEQQIALRIPEHWAPEKVRRRLHGDCAEKVEHRADIVAVQPVKLASGFERNAVLDHDERFERELNMLVPHELEELKGSAPARGECEHEHFGVYDHARRSRRYGERCHTLALRCLLHLILVSTPLSLRPAL
ncbi:MAG TPA: hypothetical protein VFK13_12010 [Gemmatimonadaceae bacterium]|nr:hypothetical protein [Gemmatimonadaceae bacterium]